MVVFYKGMMAPHPQHNIASSFQGGGAKEQNLCKA
jgi:hypothetical protein